SLETDHYIDIIQNSLMACHGFGERSATTVAMLGKYVLLMLVPYPLLSDYSYNYIPVMDWLDWQPILTILFFGFAVYYGIKNFRNKNIVVFGALFFCISISMVCNVFITISWTLGERFLFIPTIGYCVAFIYLLTQLIKVPVSKDAPSPLKNMKFMALFGIFVLVYAFETVNRNTDWKSNMTLFKADVTKAPENARLQALYAKCLNDKAELEGNMADANEAEKYYQSAVDIYPYRDFINGLATIQNLKGDFTNARNNFLKALSIADSIPDYWHNLGIAYQGLKKLDSSIYAYETAIKYNPDYIKSIINLSGVYGEDKQFEKAIATCRRAMQLNPAETRLYSNMCVYFRDMGNKDSAVYYYNKSLGK
ncbi:MAG: tetratricopeptide repeat protein, partial [Bacteroidetes bacterium]|nr:tetratricopeptide repeat protein [Bacteroidota bacterium]